MVQDINRRWMKVVGCVVVTGAAALAYSDGLDAERDGIRFLVPPRRGRNHRSSSPIRTACAGRRS